MFMTYFRLATAAIFPVIISGVLYTANKKSKFGNLKDSTKQIVYGLIFGCLSILASEFGVPMPGAKINARDAGHNFPLLKKKDGKFEFYKEKVGFVLAGMDGVRYKEYEFDFEVGDEIFVYTDGVTEATDANIELYGNDRLESCVNSLGTVTSEEFCVEVRKNVDEFVGEAPQFDDMTMLHLRRLS